MSHYVFFPPMEEKKEIFAKLKCQPWHRLLISVLMCVIVHKNQPGDMLKVKKVVIGCGF